MIKARICIKQKATLFILVLISILMLTLYFQNRAANKNYLKQLENTYVKSFENYKKTFLTKLLKYYEDITPFIRNDEFRQSLYVKNKYLKQIEIKKISSSKYNDRLNKGEALFDAFRNEKNEVFYKLLIPLKEDTLQYYITYIIDVRMFLSSLKKYDGSNGIIFVMNGDRSDDIFLEEYLESDIFKFMVESCPVNRGPVLEVQEEFYVKKELELRNLDGKLVSNGVFFLDVTNEKKAFISMVRNSILTSIILFILAAVIVNYFFNSLIKKINQNEDKLKQINKDLELMVETETNKRLETQKQALEQKQKSEHLLIQQSKLALMGEMIGNIAHQWRQPLMQLSAINMFLDAYNEKGKLSDEKLNTKLKDSNSIIDYMSRTIEDFRNYYKPEKEKELFLIKDSIDSALFIISSSLKNSQIELETIYEDENISFTSYKNEFSQALLNVISNAKDILNNREIKDSKISIKVKELNKDIIISIEDNAGGIKEDIIDKVFEPYFTTKHKSQGTGIGLYMTKMIIENNMNGHIKVDNTKTGAKFTIILKDDK